MPGTIHVDDAVADEQQGQVTFTVRLDGTVAAGTAPSVRYALQGGTASSSADFLYAEGLLGFAPGETGARLQVSLFDDAERELPEDFLLFLYDPVDLVLGDAVARGLIIDNDAPVGFPNVSVDDLVLDETDRIARFVVTLDRPAPETVRVAYTTRDGSAIASQDYHAASGTIAFTAGATAATVDVALTDDTLAEGDEAFTLVLSDFDNAASLDPVAVATVHANDGTPRFEPSIFIDDTALDERGAFATLRVRLDAPGTRPITVRYATYDDQANAGAGDYAYASSSLVFAPGETLKTLTVAVHDDTGAEPTEDFLVYLYDAQNARIDDAVARVTVVDNDAPAGTPIASVGDLLLDEADGMARFLVTLDRPSAGTVRVPYATRDGSAQAGSDFTASSGVLHFLPGETARIVSIALANDPFAELDETFTLELSEPSGATLRDTDAAARIVANDGAPLAAPWVLLEDTIAGEADRYADVTVRLAAPGTGPISMRYAVANDTAAAGSDYGYADGTLHFAPGETAKTIRVTLREDDVREAPEDFFVYVYDLSGATVADTTARITIIDNDAPAGTPRVTVSDLALDEADRTARFTVTLDRPADGPLAVSYATRDGSAHAGSDYAATTGTLHFAAGETVRTVQVPITNDTAAEGNETFALWLTDLGGATSLDPVGNAAIAASDGPFVTQPAVSIDDVTVDESSAHADVTVRLSAQGSRNVSVRYATFDDFARHDTDYAYQEGTLHFAAGETLKTVRVRLQDDGTAEAVESFTVALWDASDAVIEDTDARVTVIDNDAPAGRPVVSIAPVVVDETERVARFVVTLDRPSSDVVAMRYATLDGTASAGLDFERVAGALAFAPGETARTVSVPLIDDRVAEGEESFALALTDIGGAEAQAPSATARIGANDGARAARPTIAVEDIVVDEGQAYAEFVLSLDAPSAAPVQVYHYTGSDTAVHGEDFAYVDGTVTFAAGDTIRTVRVALADDARAEGTERFFLHLFVTGGSDAVLDRGAAIAMLLDDDGNATLPGASGDTEFLIEDPTTRVHEDPGAGVDRVRSRVDHALDDHVEHLTLIGTAALRGLGNGLDNRLTGNSGDNVLAGGAGDDTLEGGAGVDAAVFSGMRADYTVRRAGTQWEVAARAGDDGVDRLASIEQLVFADMGVPLITPARDAAPVYGRSNGFLFDPVYYLLDNPDLVPVLAPSEALPHYLNHGAGEGRTPNGWFDAAWYANRWDDLRPLNLDAATLFQHYNLFGVWEGRAAGPAVGAFDGNRYLADNPDVAAYVDAFIGDFLGSRTNGAIAHYVIYGAAEGRVGYDSAGGAIDLGFAV